MGALTGKRILIIHPSPDSYVLNSLKRAGGQLILAGNKVSTAAKEQALHVLEVDPFDTEQLVEMITNFHRQNPLDLVLPTWEGCVEQTSLLAEHLGLRGNTLVATVNSRNKYLATLAYQQEGVQSPKSVVVTDEKMGIQLLQKEIGFPAIVKLPSSTNSQSVTRVDCEDEFLQAFTRISNLYQADPSENRLKKVYAGKAATNEILIQEYVTGLELNIDLMYADGVAHAIGIFEKAPMEGPYFAETQSIYPVALSQDQLNECIDMAAKAVQALGATVGAAHVEIRYTENGPTIIETALRPGGAFTAVAIEQIFGINVYQSLAQVLLGESIPIVQNSLKACLYGGILLEKKGRVVHVSGAEVFQEIDGLVDYKFIFREGDIVSPLPEGSDHHLVHFILNGESRDDVLLKTKRIRERVTALIEEEVNA